MEHLTKSLINISLSIVLLIAGSIAAWYFLPETIYETISRFWKIEFSINNADFVTSQKTRTLFSVLFGFSLLYTKTFSIFRRSFGRFIFGFLSIFLGFFIAILISILIFKNSHEYILSNEVKYD